MCGSIGKRGKVFPYRVEDPPGARVTVRTNHEGRLEGGRTLPVKGEERPARLREDEPRGGVVPGHEADLEVELSEARGEVAQLQGGGAVAPDVVALHVKVMDDGAAGEGEVLPVDGEGREEDPLLEGSRGDMDGLSVEKGALPLLGGVELVPPGGVDHTEDRLAALHESDADAAVLVPAGVVGRPVDGVDDPDGLMALDVAEALLLAEEADIGEMEAQLLRQPVLDGKVRRGDDILPRALVPHLESARAVHQRGGCTDNVRDKLQICLLHTHSVVDCCFWIASWKNAFLCSRVMG